MRNRKRGSEAWVLAPSTSKFHFSKGNYGNVMLAWHGVLICKAESNFWDICTQACKIFGVNDKVENGNQLADPEIRTCVGLDSEEDGDANDGDDEDGNNGDTSDEMMLVAKVREMYSIYWSNTADCHLILKMPARKICRISFLVLFLILPLYWFFHFSPFDTMLRLTAARRQHPLFIICIISLQIYQPTSIPRSAHFFL